MQKLLNSTNDTLKKASMVPFIVDFKGMIQVCDALSFSLSWYWGWHWNELFILPW